MVPTGHLAPLRVHFPSKAAGRPEDGFSAWVFCLESTVLPQPPKDLGASRMPPPHLLCLLCAQASPWVALALGRWQLLLLQAAPLWALPQGLKCNVQGRLVCFHMQLEKATL